VKLGKILISGCISVIISLGPPKTLSSDLEPEITEHGALYRLKLSQFPLGVNVLRKIVRTPEGNYLATFKASSALIKIEEKSSFIITDEKIRSIEYLLVKKIMGKKQTENIIFDWKNSILKQGSQKSVLKVNTLDKLSMQYQLQLDLLKQKNLGIGMEFMYQVVDKKNIKEYKFRYIGKETISTTLGSLTTERLEKQSDNKNRTTIIWLANEYNYNLVRMLQNDGVRSWQLDIKENNWIKDEKTTGWTITN
tara:strand:+ start:33 stop:785 length:753 start_codon:yes stop_codon:yes gene_type:complete